MMSQVKTSILSRLTERPVIGDGGCIFEMERRGYTMAGPWTPEAVVEHPDAVLQIHKEFVRAGADVLQTFTFYASEDKVEIEQSKDHISHSSEEINNAGCALAKQAAEGTDVLVAAGVSHMPSYSLGKDKDFVQAEFRKQTNIFAKNEVDFLVCETIARIEEMEWAIEVCKEAKRPVAANMSIGPMGDQKGISPGQCAVRMARAGADIVGLNCYFDPDITLKTIKMMKEALDQAGLKPFLMTQPNGFRVPEEPLTGWLALAEFPFAMEPRGLTRWDVQKYAREAHEAGVHYIGGCCGFSAYHVRAIAEELLPETNRVPVASAKHKPWGTANEMSNYPCIHKRSGKQYWSTLQPATGRLLSAATSVVDPVAMQPLQ